MLLKKKIPLFVILIPIIVFIFFLPSLSNGFVNWDDPDIFWGNPLVKNFSWSSIQHIFKVMWAGQYHRFIPLTMVLFDAEYHFFGLNPLGYHCVSVLFHSINSLGVFVLIYFLTDKIGISVFAALLFGLHPLEIQPVIWCAASQYPLGAFFILSTLILYLYKLEFFAWLTYILALLFYSQLALPLPLLLIAIDYYYLGKISWADIYRKIPFILLSFYFGLMTLKSAQQTAPDYIPYFLNHHLSLIQRLNLSSEAICMYVQKFLIPYPLACFYPIKFYSHGPLFMYTGGIIFFLMVALRHQGQWRLSLLGLIWFLISLAPFLHIYGVNESIINDRYMYMAIIGSLLFFIGFIGNLKEAFSKLSWPMRIILKGLLFFWIVVMVFISTQQLEVWRDSGRLWTNFIFQYPDFPDGYINRSDYYLKINQPQLALSDTDYLLNLNPNNPAAYQNRGHAYYQLRQWQAEIDAYTKVIKINPHFVKIYVDRGAAYFILGKDKNALNDFNKALELDPEEEGALYNRGRVYYYLKDYRHALDDFNKLLVIDPNYTEAKNIILEIKKILNLKE